MLCDGYIISIFGLVLPFYFALISIFKRLIRLLFSRIAVCSVFFFGETQMRINKKLHGNQFSKDSTTTG